ncbi:MAG: gamma-glutamyltransferase [Candidatus Tectimicrobiota bacterium]
MPDAAVLYQAHRPVVMGCHGMVTSAHPLASQAGLRMLLEGGNAFDAAVAAAATLNVVEPYMSGVGGIGVLLCYIAAEKRLRVLNFSGRAPYAAVPERYTPETQLLGLAAPLVPGNVAGWCTLLDTYGSMALQRVLAPAIAYAEQGVPLTTVHSAFIANNRQVLASFPTSAQIFLPQATVPAPGTVLRQRDLAQSLRLLAEGGQDVFYRGALADRMLRVIAQRGGLLTRQDLQEYRAAWEEPISTTYRGYEVYVPPPNSSAFQILEALNILEGDDLDRLGYATPAALHLLMEAVKLSVTDRIAYAGDPEHHAIPLERLLSKDYARLQRQRINPQQAALVWGERAMAERHPEVLRPGVPASYASGLTTHLAAADAAGNVVTLTQTLGMAFGCGMVLGDTGIFLNNMMYWFETDPTLKSPNLVAPRKRVDFCLAPMQVFRDGVLYMSLGTPGSYGILQTTVQMLLHHLDYGMNIQEAIEAPRFRYFEGRRVEMENRFPQATRQAMEALGHQVDTLEAWSPSVGGGQGIVRHPESGAWQGGADPRRDGYAVGF